MTQNFRYVPEIGALLQHTAGQGVAKQMRGYVLGSIDTRQSHCPAHNITNGRWSRERHTRRACTQTDSLRSPRTSVQPQIAGDGDANITRQRKDVLSSTFASDQDLACPPMDVLKFE